MNIQNVYGTYRTILVAQLVRKQTTMYRIRSSLHILCRFIHLHTVLPSIEPYVDPLET